MISKASLSRDQKYRYSLTRIWDEQKECVLFIGLNPSIADAIGNDPTIRRLIGFAQRWGFGGIYVCNLFAYRTPDPRALFKVIDPVGRYNNRYIRKMKKMSSITVLMYGNHGKHLNRHKEILKRIEKPYCVKMSKGGMPMHPLYLKYTEAPLAYR
jgi:hypothetical protein